MSELDKALADVKLEGDIDPFAALEKETPSESPAEKEPKVDEPKEGENTPKDNVPFHKHPRWIEREEELKTLRENEEKTAKELAELKAFKAEIADKIEPTFAIPEWFKELYGENDVAWKKYAEREAQREVEIEQKILARQEDIKKKAETETQFWNKWVDIEVNKLKTLGLDFDRNELLKTMVDNQDQVKDENGNFDFAKGYKLYSESKPVPKPDTSNARKQIADITAKNAGGDKKSKDYLTPADLRNKSWSDI